MYMLGSYSYHTVGKEGAPSFIVGQPVGYLLYPLLGCLTDVYFTRYKFVLMSFIAMIATTVAMDTTIPYYKQTHFVGTGSRTVCCEQVYRLSDSWSLATANKY